MLYAKFAAAVVATVLTALVAALTDGAVTTLEWVNVAIAGVTAAGVFAAPNVPGSRYTKATLAVLGAVLVALTSMLTDGISSAELAQLTVVALGAVGVYAVPNGPSDAFTAVPKGQEEAGNAEVRQILAIAGGIVLAAVVLLVLNLLLDQHIGIG